MKTPATLTPDDTDATIFDVMAAHTRLPTRVRDGNPVIWSRTQDRWLNPAEFAAEWRHRWRYREVMGSEEEARMQTRYEEQHGI